MVNIEHMDAKFGVMKRTRELAEHYLLPAKMEFDNKANPEFARKMANATAAVEVVCSLVNTFGVMQGNKNFNNELAISDLVFVLNTNTFWITNASYLVPLMNAAVNAFTDNTLLQVNNDPLWKSLQYHNRSCWLELLPAIVFCLKGYPEMRKISLEIKQAFDPMLHGV